MKNARFITPLIVAVLYANLVLAQTVSPMQEGVGGGGNDTASVGYQAKTAVGDAGVSESQSANYIYDHGTLWFDEGYSELPPAQDPTPTGGGGSGGNSGSGWFSSLFSASPQIGGVSPAVDVPFKDTPVSEAVVASIPQSTKAAVRITDASRAIEYAVRATQSTPQIIRLVDDKGVTREISIVLFKRIVPWPLWIAFFLIVLGAIALLVFTLMRGAKEYILWVGGVLILIGVVGGVIIRFAYHASPIDTRAITSIGIVSASDASEAVKKLMTDLPIGVHIVKAVDAVGRTTLTVKVFITPALPI